MVYLFIYIYITYISILHYIMSFYRYIKLSQFTIVGLFMTRFSYCTPLSQQLSQFFRLSMMVDVETATEQLILTIMCSVAFSEIPNLFRSPSNVLNSLMFRISPQHPTTSMPRCTGQLWRFSSSVTRLTSLVISLYLLYSTFILMSISRSFQSFLIFIVLQMCHRYFQYYNLIWVRKFYYDVWFIMYCGPIWSF